MAICLKSRLCLRNIRHFLCFQIHLSPSGSAGGKNSVTCIVPDSAPGCKPLGKTGGAAARKGAQIDFRQNIRYAILDKAKNGMLRKGASERVLYRMCTKTFTWRLLTGPELTEVYLNEMRRDFPAGELKPLSMILNSEADGTAHTWGVFDSDTLAAYLLMVRPEGCRVSQLDYFAVVPAYRAHGIGAQLLAQLPAQEGDAEAILIEAEMPEKAEDAAMAVRRLGFYARCGAWDTHYTEHLFDAWFRILVLDCPGCAPLAPETAVEALTDCYRRTISPTQWQKHVRFFAPDGSTYC